MKLPIRPAHPFFFQRSRFRFLSIFSALCFFSLFHGGAVRAEISPETRALVDSVNAKLGETRNLKAFIDLDVEDAPTRSSLKTLGQIAAQQSPFRFYLKAFSPLTPHHLSMISREGRFWLKVPKMRTIYTGPLEALAQEDFELKVTPKDFERMFFPEPIATEGRDLQVRVMPPDLILTISAPAGQQTLKERELRIDQKSLKITKDIRYSLQETPFMEIGWNSFSKNEAGVEFPAVITYLRQPLGRKITVRLKQWAANTELLESLFESPSEEGFKVETVG